MITHYEHFSQVLKDEWRWPHFKPSEIACQGTGALVIASEALDLLEALRAACGAPLVINSAYRTPSHNAAIKGAPKSKHLEGRAFDIAIKLERDGKLITLHDKERLIFLAGVCGFKGLGIADTFIHVDDRDIPEVWRY